MVANAARAAALATGTKVTIDRYGEYRDGITVGSLEELGFAYAQKFGAPRINPEPQRPDGYEETGFVTREIPGVSVGSTAHQRRGIRMSAGRTASRTWATRGSCSTRRS